MTSKKTGAGERGEVRKKHAQKTPKPTPSAVVHDLAWKWSRWTVWPMFVLSVVFMALQLALLFGRSDMREWEFVTIGGLFLGLWAAFIVDFLIRLLAQKNKRLYLKDHWVELVVLAIPILRPGLPLYYLWKTPYFNRGTARVLRQRYLITVAAIAVFFLYLVSTGVYLVEHNAKGANITSWGDAMWWGVVTITTVGYGDVYPVTFFGRLLGALMMVVGLLLIGVVSGSFVGYLSEKVKAMTVEHTIRERKAAQQEAEEAARVGPLFSTESARESGTSEWAQRGAAEVKEALSRTQTQQDTTAPADPASTRASADGPADASASAGDATGARDD